MGELVQLHEHSDLLKEARETIAEIMRGHGGRNALARLSAAKEILSGDYLSHLSDEALLAEVKRRADRAGGADDR